MNLPGINKLVLTKEAMQNAIEGALNVGKKPGEGFIRVTNIESSYGWEYTISITTDEAKHEEEAA